jgi:hypothetical protein
MSREQRQIFERDERLEAMLRVRAESKIKFEMNYSFNDKRAVERYAELKAKHERLRRWHTIQSEHG